MKPIHVEGRYSRIQFLLLVKFTHKTIAEYYALGWNPGLELADYVLMKAWQEFGCRDFVGGPF